MKFSTMLFLLALTVLACAPGGTVNLDLQEYQDFGYSLAWSPDDELLAVTANTGLYGYDTHTFKQVAAFAGLGGSTATFARNYMAAIDGDGLYVWDRNGYKLLFQEKTADKIQFQSVSISPDGKWLVTGEQKQFRLWNLPEGDVIAEFPVDGFVSNLAFTEDNTLIVIEQYKAVIQEWDLENQEMIRAFEIPRDVLFFTLSADGSEMLVDYGESGVELWNVETGEAGHYYLQMQGASGWTRLSGDNQVAIVWGYAIDGNNSGMGVWDLSADKRLHEFSTSYVRGDGWRFGALNSNGSVLAASNNEGYIHFYDLKSGNQIGEIYLPYRFNG
jgi:WD40 repeat protein